MPGPVRTPEDIERGLSALVIAGSSTRASEVTGIPATTLKTWKQKHADRYEQLRHELEPQIARTIAAEAEAIAQKLSEREHQLADALTPEAISQLKPSEIAATLRNVTTSKALQVDKISSPLRERPSHVQHTSSPDEIVTRLAKALGFDATSTAIEEPPEIAQTSEVVSPNAREGSSSS